MEQKRREKEELNKKKKTEAEKFRRELLDRCEKLAALEVDSDGWNAIVSEVGKEPKYNTLVFADLKVHCDTQKPDWSVYAHVLQGAWEKGPARLLKAAAKEKAAETKDVAPSTESKETDSDKKSGLPDKVSDILKWVESKLES